MSFDRLQHTIIFLLRLIAKIMAFPTWDVFERRGCDCYIRTRTMDDYLPLLFVVSEPTLHVSHWPHHTESIILQQTLIHIPSWLSRWLTRFVYFKRRLTWFNNSPQLLYSKCSLWNIVCKNDVYKIPEVLFISLTLNWH